MPRATTSVATLKVLSFIIYRLQHKFIKNKSFFKFFDGCKSVIFREKRPNFGLGNRDGNGLDDHLMFNLITHQFVIVVKTYRE
jgi:hypothetical protein